MHLSLELKVVILPDEDIAKIRKEFEAKIKEVELENKTNVNDLCKKEIEAKVTMPAPTSTTKHHRTGFRTPLLGTWKNGKYKPNNSSTIHRSGLLDSDEDYDPANGYWINGIFYPYKDMEDEKTASKEALMSEVDDILEERRRVLGAKLDALEGHQRKLEKKYSKSPTATTKAKLDEVEEEISLVSTQLDAIPS